MHVFIVCDFDEKLYQRPQGQSAQAPGFCDGKANQASV